MPFINTAVTVNIVCWDTANNAGKTGDASNITVRGVRDGTLFTPSDPSITQVDSTNLPGVYKVSLTAGENNGTFLTLGGKSSSTGCVIIPVSWSNELTGDAFARLGAPAGASVSADIAAVKSETAAIVTDTNELQTDLANGGRLDLLVDAIKAKTDNLPASPAAVGSAMTLTSAYDAAKTAASQASVNTIDNIVDAILEDTGTTLDGKINTIDDYIDTEVAAILAAVDTEVAAIKAKTDNLPANPANEATLTTIAGYLDTEIAAILAVTDKIDTAMALDGAVYRFTSNALEQAPTSGSAPTVTQIRQEMDSNSTKLANLDATISSRSTLTAAQVWANATRTLSSFGTLANDTRDAVWGATTRTLTSFGTLVSDVATAVWGAGTRTLTAISDSSGVTTLLSRIGSALTISSGKVTVGTNDDKTGYSLSSSQSFNLTGNITGNLSGSVGSVSGAVGSVTGNVGGNVAGSVNSVTNGVTVTTNNDKTGYALSAAGLAAIWDRLTSALTTAGSIGKRLADYFAGSSGTAPTLDATALQICNNALLMLGNITITSLDDTGKAAVLCNHFYQQVIDATLRAYKWNCATVRDTLTADETAPEFGFAYRYAVPDDCLRVLGMSEDKTRFKVENGYILTDDSEGMVSYIKRIDAADMDKLLIDAASARMAATLAFPLTNSQSVAEAMWKFYQERLDEARTVDASEGSSEQMLNDDWLNARR